MTKIALRIRVCKMLIRMQVGRRNQFNVIKLIHGS